MHANRPSIAVWLSLLVLAILGGLWILNIWLVVAIRHYDDSSISEFSFNDGCICFVTESRRGPAMPQGLLWILARSRDGWGSPATGLASPLDVKDLIPNSFSDARNKFQITKWIVPSWIFILPASIVYGFWLRRRWASAGRHRSGHCPTCGYDLHATSDRCPECGRSMRSDAILQPNSLREIQEDP